MSADSLPSGWATTCLGELLPLSYGKALTEKDRSGSGTIPVYGSSGVVGIHDCALVDGPALIVGRKGNVGSVYLAQGQFWAIDTAYFTKGHTGLELDYFKYLLEFIGLRSLDKSTAVPGLSRTDYNKIKICVPPTPEQHRTVEVIDALLTDFDSAVAGLKRVQANLKRYRASVLNTACEGRLVPAANSRILRTIDCLAQPLANGRSPKQTTSGARILKLTALQEGRIDLSASRFGDVGEPLRHQLSIRAGDVFVSRGNGSIRLVGIAGLVVDSPEDEVLYPDTMIRVRLNPEVIDSRYFTYVWNSHHVRRQIESTARTTAGIHKISQGDIENFTLFVPDVATQAKIVEELDRRLIGQSVLAREIGVTLVRAASLRQSILKRAFEGKLVPQDTNDEPASVLLERIRAGGSSIPSVNRKARSKAAAANTPGKEYKR